MIDDTLRLFFALPCPPARAGGSRLRLA